MSNDLDLGYLGGSAEMLRLTEEYMNEVAPQRIFLSHKGADKPTVRKYARMLTELGFQPWLDEKAMAAGQISNVRSYKVWKIRVR